MSELTIRFLIGGFIVSLFAMLGEVLRPKSFAGLFGAAPSIALATVGITIHQKGQTFAALEARSMMIGAIAFFVYAVLTSWTLRRYRVGSLAAALMLMPVWFAISLGSWALLKGNFLR
jgi:hypothetical protein